jgi:hypothetical protein
MNRRQALAGLSALTVSLAAPNRSSALGLTAPISTEQAKGLGVEVRSEVAGPDHVRVELEFTGEGAFKGFSRVDLRIGEGDNPPVIAPSLVTAPLREDRSKPGRVVVGFTADRAHLGRLTLGVIVPGPDGGSTYLLRVTDFVELETVR